MSDLALIADLVRAGVAPELVARVAAAIADVRAEGASTREENRAAARKARNARYYKTRSDDLRRFKTSEILPPSPLKETSPTPPKENNPTPSNTTGSARTHAHARGGRLPEGWTPSKALCDFADGLGVGGHLFDEAVAEFRDYWRAVPGQRGIKLDWDATFRNRLRETAGKKRGNGNGKGSLVDAGRKLIRRLDEQFAHLDDVRPADSGAGGDPTVRMFPGFRGQRS